MMTLFCPDSSVESKDKRASQILNGRIIAKALIENFGIRG
jgi:hypothetical protein